LLRKFPTYEFDERLRIVPGQNTPVINFDELKELLLSTDLSRNEELEFADKEEFRFLDGKTDLNSNMVAF